MAKGLSSITTAKESLLLALNAGLVAIHPETRTNIRALAGGPRAEPRGPRLRKLKTAATRKGVEVKGAGITKS